MVMDTVLKEEDKTQQLTDISLKVEETTPVTKEPSPQEKTFTQKELDDAKEVAVHNALMRAGRDWKSIELERDKLATQLEDIKTANDKLTIQIDELASDNPDKFNVIKKGRVIDEQEQRLKQERLDFQAEKLSHQEQIKLATNTLKEKAMRDIASESEGGDYKRLKEIVEVSGVTSEEQIRKIAGTLWQPKKKEETPNHTELKLDSNLTIGDISEETIRENYRRNPDNQKAKAEYLAWRRKKGI